MATLCSGTSAPATLVEPQEPPLSASPHPAPRSEASPAAVRTLPLLKWAHRLRSGTVRLTGTLCEPVGPIPAGPTNVTFDFTGGHAPRLVGLYVNEQRIDGLVAVDTLIAIVDRLHDGSADATATPDGDLLVRLALGVEVVIPARTRLHAHCGSRGAPSTPILDRPLVLEFDGDGLRLSHGMKWVARLAEIRLGRASLHPDGTVGLDARATSRTADLALRMPLTKAAAHLTDLVRRTPKVRAFLRHR